MSDTTETPEVDPIEQAMRDAVRDGIIAEAREFMEVDIERLNTNQFKPTMIFREEGITTPRAVFFPELDGDLTTRDKIGWGTMILAASIDDLRSITWVTDSYTASSAKKADGSAWEYGDMQKAFEEKNENAHLVSEMLNYQTLEITPEGLRQASMVCFKYDRDADGNALVDWDNPQCLISGDNGEMKGFYVDMLNHALDAPKIRQHMKELMGDEYQTFGLEEDIQKLHTTIVAVKMILQQIQMAVLIPCRSKEEGEVIKDSFENGELFGPHGVAVYDESQLDLISKLEDQFNLESHDKDSQ